MSFRYCEHYSIVGNKMHFLSIDRAAKAPSRWSVETLYALLMRYLCSGETRELRVNQCELPARPLNAARANSHGWARPTESKEREEGGRTRVSW